MGPNAMVSMFVGHPSRPPMCVHSRYSIGSSPIRTAGKKNLWPHLLVADCRLQRTANPKPKSHGLASLDAKLTTNIERGEASDKALPADSDCSTHCLMKTGRCATKVEHRCWRVASARIRNKRPIAFPETQGNMGYGADNGTT